MNITLKKVGRNDIPKLVEIEKSVAGAKTYSAETNENEWEKEIKDNVVYLIEKDGEAVGDISYEYKDPNHAYISGLAVEPRFQGQGIARQAMELLLKELKDIERVDLVTHPDNLPALRLYQSLGFVIESQVENYYGDGEPRLVLVLKK